MNQDKKLRVIQNVTTCFQCHKKHEVKCHKKSCDYWVSAGQYQNCVLIAADEGPHTLQSIGSMYGLTRMRICQIEKKAHEKLKRITQ